MIKDKLVEITEAEAIEDSENKKKGMYYSPEVGLFGQSRTTTILKSKFKFKKIPNIRIGDKTHRCVEFKKEYLDRIKATYNIPDKMEIIKRKQRGSKVENENVTLVTAVTLLPDIEPPSDTGLNSQEAPNIVNISTKCNKRIENSVTDPNNYNVEGLKSDQKETLEPSISERSVTSVTTVTFSFSTLDPRCFRLIISILSGML